MPFFDKLSVRLFLAFLAVGMVPLLFFLLTMTRSVEDYYVKEKEKQLKYQATLIAVSFHENKFLTDESRRRQFDDEIMKISRTEGFRIIVADRSAVIINDSGRTETGKTYVTPEVIRALGNDNVAALTGDRENMLAAVSVLSDESEVIGAVLIIASISDINLILSDMNGKFLMAASVLAAVILFLVVGLSNIMINPLKTIMGSVRKISEGHLDQRVIPAGSREFAELAEAFNDMTEKLSLIETSRQEFVSNVSHELKTPLSSIKVLSESLLLTTDASADMYVEFLRDINSEIDRMTRIVNELLALVKLDRTEQDTEFQPVQLNAALEAILKRLYPLAEKKRIELLYDASKRVTIEADEMKLSLAVSNLVENAIKYTGDGGMVKLTLDADSQHAFITVMDNGAGIAEEEQSKIFDRFYRVDKTRDRETGGTGLGLSITQKTILLHNGSIKLASREGEGTTFVVRLPLARARAI